MRRPVLPPMTSKSPLQDSPLFQNRGKSFFTSAKRQKTRPSPGNHRAKNGEPKNPAKTESSKRDFGLPFNSLPQRRRRPKTTESPTLYAPPKRHRGKSATRALPNDNPFAAVKGVTTGIYHPQRNAKIASLAKSPRFWNVPPQKHFFHSSQFRLPTNCPSGLN